MAEQRDERSEIKRETETDPRKTREIPTTPAGAEGDEATVDEALRNEERTSARRE